MPHRSGIRSNVSLLKLKNKAPGLGPGAYAYATGRSLLLRGGHEILKRLRRSPAHVRKAQAEWIALAERALRI